MSTIPNTLLQPSPNVVSLGSGTCRPSVLLAEDDRSIRRYLEVILERAGFNVIAAADGLEAMKAALTSTVDAVVTDAIMPGLNGYELCRFLRRHPRFARTPLVLLSGVEQDVRTRESDIRPDLCLAKPVRPEELTDWIRRLLTEAS